MSLFRRSRWVPAVGLEIHAQIAAKTKIFSRGEAVGSRDSQPNTSVALFDIALPGTMPVRNIIITIPFIREYTVLRVYLRC